MAFRKAKITSRLVEALKPGEIVMDTELPGYMVRRQHGEARTYAVRKAARGGRHYITIGEDGREGWTETKARAEALIVIVALKQGRDPAAERMKARGIPTAARWAETVYEARKIEIGIKPGTARNYRGFIDNHIAPRSADGTLRPNCLGRLKIDQVSSAHVAALHQKLRATPRMANQVLTFLGVMFSEAISAKLLPATAGNPARGIKRHPERKRDRFLTEPEIAALGDALASAEASGTEDTYAVAAIRLLLLTGCRLSEILTAQWNWIDTERGILNLPDSKTGAKPVHLSPAALEVLAAIPRIDGNPYVIAGRKQGGHFVGLPKVWARIRKAAGLKPSTRSDGNAEHVRIHDLRHSFASLTAASGASLLMIGKLLGHKNQSTTARYAHLCDDPLKRVNDAVGAKVGAAFKPREKRTAEIVELPLKA